MTLEGAWNADQELQALNDAIPGFGGYSVGADGRIHMFLKDVSQGASASAILRNHLQPQFFSRRPGVSIDFDRIEIRQGHYEIFELLNWRRSLDRVVLQYEGVNLSDLDEANSTILYAVTDAAAAARVVRAAAVLGIPTEALRTFFLNPISTSSTLRDDFSTVPGGVLIFNRVQGQCTAGFNAEVGSTTTVDLITASHCTTSPHASDSDTIFQAGTTRPIGYEVSDYAGFTSASDPDCPSGETCRYSDAAIIRYFSSSTPDFGYLARPEASGINIDPYTPYFTVIGKKLSSHANDTVQKVGQKTGWTGGTVAYTCLNGARSRGVYMLCQNAVAAVSDSGDSGAPVFALSGTTSARLYGILWGMSTDPTTQIRYFIYSPIGNIENEFSILHVN